MNPNPISYELYRAIMTVIAFHSDHMIEHQTYDPSNAPTRTSLSLDGIARFLGNLGQHLGTRLTGQSTLSPSIIFSEFAHTGLFDKLANTPTSFTIMELARIARCNNDSHRSHVSDAVVNTQHNIIHWRRLPFPGFNSLAQHPNTGNINRPFRDCPANLFSNLC